MCSIEGENQIAAWSEKTHRARKTHECLCCGAKIQPGEQYVRTFMLLDDRSKYADVWCQPCRKVAAEFEKEHRVKWSADGMTEVIRECVDARDSFASMLKWSRHLKGINRRWKNAKSR